MSENKIISFRDKYYIEVNGKVDFDKEFYYRSSAQEALDEMFRSMPSLQEK